MLARRKSIKRENCQNGSFVQFKENLTEGLYEIWSGENNAEIWTGLHGIGTYIFTVSVGIDGITITEISLCNNEVISINDTSESYYEYVKLDPEKDEFIHVEFSDGEILQLESIRDAWIFHYASGK